jgi:hypothetical protein
MNRIAVRFLSVFVLIAAIPACGDSQEGGGGGEGEATLELIGDFTDGFGTVFSVTTETVTLGIGESASVFIVLSFDNEDDYLIAQNHEDNEYSGGLYSRFDWLEEDGDMYYCQPAYDANDAAAAEATSADPTDMESGCGGFGWSELTEN